MLATIKGVDVGGKIDEKGKCPNCSAVLVIKDSGYTYIKNRGIAKFDEEESYIKCSSCGKFILL